MVAICVDDEPLAVEYTLRQCRLLPEIDEITGFTDAHAALDWISQHPADLCLLDINMPQIDGITLAARIKQKLPGASIIFLTAYKEYAFDAYAAHPSGYLLKPVSQEKLAEEVHYIHMQKPEAAVDHIRIRTFGNFDVYVDGIQVAFKLSKAKEILAYLIDKHGSGVARVELFAAIWGDKPYDRRMQKQLDVYIRSLRDTLQEYGISEILEMKKGVLNIKPETFTCDLYRFYAGDSSAVNSFWGEYMSSYSWASITEGFLYNRTIR